MPLKRIAKYSLVTGICAVCILIAAYCYFFYVYMPAHFQKEVLPALMKNAGISGFSGKVKSAGAFGANLGELCIGDPENPALKVHSVIIKYRFHNIFMPRRPNITSIEFKGLELICRLQGKNFAVNNIDLKKFIGQLKEHFSGRHENAIGTWGNARLKITDGLMRLDWNGTKLLLPFELHFNPDSQNWESFTAELKYTWREHPINAKLTVDMQQQQFEINFKAQSEMKKLLDLLEKSNRFDIPQGLELSGLLKVAGTVNFTFSPWKIQKLMLSGTSRNCYVNYNALQLCNKKRPSGLKIPMTISIDSTPNGYLWKLENAMVKKPALFFVRNVSCLVPADIRKALEFNGLFEFQLDKLAMLEYYHIKNLNSNSLVRKLTGSYNRASKKWQLKTPETGSHARHAPVKAVMTCSGNKIFAEIDDFGINGAGNINNGYLQLDMLIREFSATGHQNACFANKIKLNSLLELASAPAGEMRIRKNSFKFTLPEFSVSSLARQLELQNITVTGNNSFTGWEMNGFALTADMGNISLKQDGKHLTGKNNKFTLDGILPNDKKTWELAFTTASENINGQYQNCSFILRKVNSKNFITLRTPVTINSLKGIDDCNLRLLCDDSQFTAGNDYLKLAGFNFGTALKFAADGSLLKKTCSGKIQSSELQYQSCYATSSGIELTGKYEAGKKDDQNFLAHLEAAVLNVRHNNISYSAKLPHINLSGKSGLDSDGIFILETVKARSETSDFRIARGTELLEASGLNLTTDAVFTDNSTSLLEAGLKSLRLKLASEKISGIWDDINVCSSKNEIIAAAAANYKDDKIELKTMKATFAAEKAIAYGKSWKLGSSRLKGNVSGELNPKMNMVLKPEMRCYDFYAASHDTALSIPELSLKADFKNGSPTGSLFFNQAAFYKNKLSLTCTGVSMFLPFGNAAPEGTMEAKQVKLNKRELGKIDAKLQYHDGNILIRANHFSKIFSNASVFFSGKLKLASFPEWEGDFTIPEFKVETPLSVSELFPPLKNIGVTGKTALEGHIEGNLQKCTASGSIAINNGTLYFNAWELSGIKGKCVFSDLFGLKSNTRQKLHCRQLKNDTIELSDMQMEFEPSGLDKLLIDRLTAKWFGGTLTSLNSFILEKNNSIPEKINFLASDITLSPFLEYSGIKGLVTDAVVSGIIPFCIRDGKVYISGAALATKVSEMGFLRLDGDLGKYADGAESESGVSQREFALAALKRFNYNWIRLNVHNAQENAKISLHIDGYPEKTLPFRYDEQKQLFIPVTPDEPGINGDMTIETNFKIPLKPNPKEDLK